jgi:hypothetical protein
MMVEKVTVFIAVVLLAAQATSAQTATGQAMRAQRVREVIKLRLSPDRKTLEVATDGKQNFAPLKKDQTFTTTGPVAVTIERPNPLTLLVTAEVTEADDPAYATVGRLIEALLGATDVITAGAVSSALEKVGGGAREALIESASSECKDAISDARTDVNTLDRTLFSEAWSKKLITEELKKWLAAIDKAHRTGTTTGPAAIQAGLDAIQQYLDRRFEVQDKDKDNDKDKTKAYTPAEILKAATDAVQAILIADAPKGLDPACRGEINTIYGLARLTNPQERLEAVKKIYSSVLDLKETLEKTYAHPGNWYGSDNAKTSFYLRRAVEPSSQSMQVVSVKALSVDYSKLDTVTPVLVAKREDLVSASFTVKQYSWFVPEIGVGATFMTFHNPKYATTKNAAGQTVVGESFDDLTVEPTVMMNFVVRGYPGAFLTPMVQVGVSASKETPTFFFGGGLRFLHVGKGDFAFSAGVAFPWVRQLNELGVGDEVGGMKDIEDDLTFQPFGRHLYYALQYKF